MVAADPIGAINAGNYVKVPVLASTARDEGKLFPSFLPLVGGTGNARIVTDAQLFANHFSYKPDAAPQTTVDQWIAPSYLPVNAPTTGFTARAETLNRVFFLNSRDNVLNALKRSRTTCGTTASTGTSSPHRGMTSMALSTWSTCRSCSATSAHRCSAMSGSTRPTGPGRVELSAAMMQTMSSFARNGDPNNAPWA